MTEYQLSGGIANAGKVTKAGQHVLRPASPHWRTIHELLRSVRAAGFGGAPLPVTIEPDGRERLEFVDGAVPLPPYPAWAQSGDALAGTAVLLRRFHQASASFDLVGATWSAELADPAGPGPVICHNDVCLENVVFRDGRAIGLLDFDFAAPGRPVHDVAALARLCVPIDEDVSAARLGWEPADRPVRLRLLADAYGLNAAGRLLLLDVLSGQVARSGEFVRRHVEAGEPGFIAMWNEMGGAHRYDRRRRWWDEQRERFAAALR